MALREGGRLRGGAAPREEGRDKEGAAVVGIEGEGTRERGVKAEVAEEVDKGADWAGEGPRERAAAAGAAGSAAAATGTGAGEGPRERAAAVGAACFTAIAAAGAGLLRSPPQLLLLMQLR